MWMAVGKEAVLSSSAELEVGGLKAASGHAFQRHLTAATTSFPSSLPRETQWSCHLSIHPASKHLPWSEPR